jgi:hypothetical protein
MVFRFFGFAGCAPSDKVLVLRFLRFTGWGAPCDEVPPVCFGGLEGSKGGTAVGVT